MTNRFLPSLAILKVNYDVNNSDYLENFVPFVAEAIRRNDTDVVTTPNIQKMLKEHFSLSIEQSVINTLLRRCRKRGYLTRNDGVYFRNESTLKQLIFTQIENEVLAKHRYLLSSFQ